MCKVCEETINFCRNTNIGLRMIAVVTPANKETCRLLWEEAHELNLIFAKISRIVKDKN